MTRREHAFKPKRKVDGPRKGDSGKMNAKHPFSLFTESLGRARRSGDNLESSHKQAWRFYCALFTFLANIPICDVSFAETDTKTQGTPEVVSSESVVKKKIVLAPKLAVNPAPVAKKILTDLSTAKPTEVLVRDEKKKNEKKIEKTLKGRISFIRKSKMAVEYEVNKDESEDMYLTVDKNVKLRNAKKFSDIGPRDLVEVKYTQTYIEPEKKESETLILSNIVSEINFISKAKPESALESVPKGI